jgi:hypothetical protein
MSKRRRVGDADGGGVYVDKNGAAWVMVPTSDVGQIMKLGLDLSWDNAPNVTSAVYAYLRQSSPSYLAPQGPDHPQLIAGTQADLIEQIDDWASANHDVQTVVTQTVKVPEPGTTTTVTKTESSWGWLAVLVVAYLAYKDSKRGRRKR